MLKKIQTWIDRIATGVAAVLLAVMFFVLIANVILRLIPSVGGFKWYMEFSQYANVWAMLIGAVGIAISGTNLRVEVIDALNHKFSWGAKVTKSIVDVFLIIFYCIMTASGRILASKAVQAISTMPSFKMGQVYAIFPIAGVLCVIASVVHLLVTLTEKTEPKEDIAK